MRPRPVEDGVELVLLRVVKLLRFGPAETAASDDAVECRYPILGGLLAFEPGGSLLLAQRRDHGIELSLAVEGFRPRLTAEGTLARARRHVFAAIQVPLHDGVG
ncbi:MAG TPA: hypothetical protein VMN35_07980, partial [Gaiellaceae bacterium]|nr:hypothetical protein [Gaiellaceae bacterium]